MLRFRSLVALVQLTLLLALYGCGGEGGSGDTSSSDIGTLAYVTTECRDIPGVSSEHQTLHILHGEQDVAVMETPSVRITGVGGLCRLLGGNAGRGGDVSISREPFQGLAVSPDGAAVVFEVSDDFSTNPKLPLHLPPEQKGIFFVRADGSGLRPLGPASRLPFFFLLNDRFTFLLRSFAFSPDGRLITFADTGPDAAGTEAGQVVTLDVDSAQRQQVTHLSPIVPPPGFPSSAPSTQNVFDAAFIDSQTIGFFADAISDDSNPDHAFVPFVVRSDGSDEPKAVPVPVTLPGSLLVSTFVITGDKPSATVLSLPGQPQNPRESPGESFGIQEVFAVEGGTLLQLTNFQRVDTQSATVGVDRQTVFFNASADPFGTNPSENCQIFSIDRLGGNLRQLTRFSEGPHSTAGCFFGRPPLGCVVYKLSQDSRTRRLIFYSSCDPLGTNPDGAQIFAMRPDGSDLRQLTHTRGVVMQTGRLGINELPGPFAYGPYAP